MNVKVKDMFLYRACEECAIDAGRKDDALIMRIYNHIHENCDIWDYDMIDKLIEDFSNENL